MITSPITARNQSNTTTGNILVVAPQLELGSSPSSYIPRGGTLVTRLTDVIRDDLNLSVFWLYGFRDFTGPPRESVIGPPGEVGLPGSNVNLPPWVSFEQSSIGISN